MSTLTKEAGKKEDQLFRGVSHIILLCAEMLNPNPAERPNAPIVKERVYTILTKHCGLGAPDDGQASTIHCDLQSSECESSTPGFDQLRLDSQRAAAAACASVNPLATEMRTLALGNGGVIYGIEMKQQTVSPTSPTSPKGTDGDRMSILTKSTSRSSGTKSSAGKSSAGKTSGGKIRTGSISMNGSWKPKPKARAHEAPIYASMYRTFSPPVWNSTMDY
jgi:hypothetical protein